MNAAQNPVPNLVTTIASFITPMIANRIAGALGVNSGLVTTAIGALLPALLAGIAGKASTPTGAGALFDLLGTQNPDVLVSFADQIGGPNQSSLIEGGTKALTGLLGGSSLGALTSAVGQFAGATPAQASSLIGMLAPVVLGQLAGQVKASSLDAGGLATLLAGQAQNIESAMPAGFTEILGGADLVGAVKVAPAKAAMPTIATTATEPKRTPTPIPTTPTGRPEPTVFAWAPYAAGAAALLGLFYVFGGFGSAPKPATAPVQSTAPTGAATAAAQASESARKILSGLTTTLGTVKDQATAQAALPKLTETASAIDGLTKLTGTLSGDAKSTLAKLIASQLPALTPLVASVLKAPGAEALLKPVLDQIVSKLTALSK